MDDLVHIRNAHRHYERRRVAQSLYLLTLAVLFIISPARHGYAQSSCPFTEDEAVADTLDPKGYYPLEIGNIWEYVADVNGFLDQLSREEIVGDTLIDGITYYKKRVTEYDPDQRPITRIKSQSIDFIAVQDSTFLLWEKQFGMLEQEIRFNHPFHACYEGSFIAIGETNVEVRGEYDVQFTIDEDGETVQYPLLARKSFIIGVAGSQRYGYGIGKIRGGGDGGGANNLVYARVGDQELGTRLDSLFDIRVAIESPPVPRAESRLSGYPNPFSESTKLAFTLPRPDEVSLEIVDLLGRIVARPVQEAFYQAGSHEVIWQADGVAAGVYMVRLVTRESGTVTTDIVLVN